MQPFPYMKHQKKTTKNNVYNTYITFFAILIIIFIFYNNSKHSFDEFLNNQFIFKSSLSNTFGDQQAFTMSGFYKGTFFYKNKRYLILLKFDKPNIILKGFSKDFNSTFLTGNYKIVNNKIKYYNCLGDKRLASSSDIIYINKDGFPVFIFNEQKIFLKKIK